MPEIGICTTVAFWLWLGAPVILVVTTESARLAPEALPPMACDELGITVLTLLLAAHLLPLVAMLPRPQGARRPFWGRA